MLKQWLHHAKISMFDHSSYTENEGQTVATELYKTNCFSTKAKPSWFTVYRPCPQVFLGTEQNFHNSCSTLS